LLDLALDLDHHLDQEDLYHKLMFWDKAKPIVYGLRKDLAMPRFLENYEACAVKYPEWANNNPPKV